MKRKRNLCLCFILLSIYAPASIRADDEGVKWLHCTSKKFTICNDANSMFSSYEYLDATGKKELTCRSGQRLLFKYEADNKKGNLTIAIKDPQQRTLWRIDIKDFNRGRKELNLKNTGIYTIEIKAKKASGSFNLSWEIGE
ncbi:hypothetical protein JXJ21_25570 [candidate division KSB1 bacterium]|nr:hypothetical protein [candidate division KSB1 bacterium]